MKNPKKGIWGLLPLSCLPLREREGITIIIAVRKIYENDEKRFSTDLKSQ
jgi:hypothetical protein